MATDLRGQGKNENKRSDGIAATRNGHRAREKRDSVRSCGHSLPLRLALPAPGEREGACADGRMNTCR